MSKKSEFISYVESCNIFNGAPENVLSYWEALKVDTGSAEKPVITDNGKLILNYMQTVPGEMKKSKDIAEALFISSRSVAGACRKLVDDGFLEKNGKDPILYTITEKGLNFKFEN